MSTKGDREMIVKTRVLLLLVLAAQLAMVGCASGPPKDITIEGSVIASEEVNPNRDGRASPVTVVVYHLKSADAFQSSDFFSLYDPNKDVIASDLIKRVDMQLQPGQVLPIASEFDPETTHIGVLVAFRDIDNAQWRAVLPLPEKNLKEKLNPFSKKKLIINVERLSVTVGVE